MSNGRQFALVAQRQVAVARAQAIARVKARNAAIMNTAPRPTSVERIVDGMIGALEESARRKIVYRYRRLDLVARAALQWLREHSPRDSGKYADSWFAMVDGRRVDDLSNLRPGAEVIVTNDQPYSRKIDVGHMRISVPPHLVERAAQILAARFARQASVRVEYLPLPGGYTVKGALDKKLRGRPMTYPALVIRDLG